MHPEDKLPAVHFSGVEDSTDIWMGWLACDAHFGKYALFVLVRKVTDDNVLDRLQPRHGKGKKFET